MDGRRTPWQRGAHAVSTPCPTIHAADRTDASDIAARQRPIRRRYVLLAIVAVAAALACLPGRTAIAPLVESDYCYLLTAADRLYEGHGLTATQPVAPLQPWDWQYDWGFLTQWPAGYPLLICLVRFILGVSSLEACRWIGVVACAAALVGWFTWLRNGLPRGVTGVTVAAVGAACAVPFAFLVNPSTDAVLVAGLPFVLLITTRGVAAGEDQVRRTQGPSRSTSLLALAGLTAGSLVWFRYASLFVTVAIGGYLAYTCLRRRIVQPRAVCTFVLCAALPILTLLLINRALSASTSLQSQLNLGAGTEVDFSLRRLAEAWWNFAALGFYDHRPSSHWILALWPAGVMTALAYTYRRSDRVRCVIAMPQVGLSVALVGSLLAMLIVMTTVFRAKYDYAADPRYYLPVRPLYFALFVGPVLLVRRRGARLALLATLLVAGSWIVQVEWSRPYARWSAAGRIATPYGRWSRCFEPGAGELYAWLRDQSAPDLVVVSNFHEYIALETGIPAVPIPKDPPTLRAWLGRIRASRGADTLRVLFVLDPDNRWRSYWVPDPWEVAARFGLLPIEAVSPTVGGYVYRWKPSHGELVEAEPIGRCLQHRDGLDPSPVQCAGVDHPRGAAPLVAHDMGVAVEQVVDRQVVNGLGEPRLMTVKDGQALSAQPNDRRFAVDRLQPRSLEVRIQRRVGKIHVPKNERERPSEHLVKDRDSTDVTAMNDVFHAVLVKELHRLPHGQVPPVAIRQDADQHLPTPVHSR